jgi:hypothetical protein
VDVGVLTPAAMSRAEITDMAAVITVELEASGFDSRTIEQYKAAAHGAWTEFTQDYPEWLTKHMSLVLESKSPTDKHAVVLSVGIGSPYGRVEAATPAELGKRLVAHLRKRFAAGTSE